MTDDSPYNVVKVLLNADLRASGHHRLLLAAPPLLSLFAAAVDTALLLVPSQPLSLFAAAVDAASPCAVSAALIARGINRLESASCEIIRGCDRASARRTMATPQIRQP